MFFPQPTLRASLFAGLGRWFLGRAFGCWLWNLTEATACQKPIAENIWGAKKQSFKVIPCRSIEMS
jgi:hypothetical protein